jgi:predicted amidophosphoribosyltransferase
MAKQGKCESCKTRFVWAKETLLHKCHCPKCGRPLQQTSHLLKWPKLQQNPLNLSRAIRYFGTQAFGLPEKPRHDCRKGN